MPFTNNDSFPHVNLMAKKNSQTNILLLAIETCDL